MVWIIRTDLPIRESSGTLEARRLDPEGSVSAMQQRPATPLGDLVLAGDYREALVRAATAARQAALMAHLLEARGVAPLKGEEPDEVDALLLAAGRASLEARDGAAIAS
jgi:hypothetical protein